MSVATAAEHIHQQPHATAAPGTNGRLVAEDATEADCYCAIALHLSPFAWLIGIGPLALLAPLVIWLVRKDVSVYHDDHGRECVNFLLTLAILHVAVGITILGLVLWPVLWVIAAIGMIRGAIAGGKGEYFRYPMTFRFL